MADRQTLIQVLQRAKNLEKMAEENAAKIVVDLEVNGYKDAVKKIELDEVKHQKIVDQLLKMVS